ncbi:uncharacterized protein IUM83_14453 [Phytophthora cinnamomi]|uniref:uncharacterized protein n=1 Tax=Phytophthora cinnamomi TaxID=4785 RepID=UPI003559CFB6|nr:hypothetical protein IUM83_14453 [Phytophthora cinnamomi]
MDPAAQLRRQPSGPIAATLARGSSTRQRATLVLPPTSARGQLGPPGSANADASQYFSIETRLELKARLTKLQLQLRKLLVQAKLAWMRCFTEPRTKAARAAAVQMAEMARFQQIVASVVHGVYPQPEDQPSGNDDADDDGSVEEDEEDEDADEEVLTYLNRPMHVDLPSMETYCKHVAPPYSSYLPNNTATKKFAAIKKLI